MPRYAPTILTSPAKSDEILKTGGIWAVIDERIGAIGLYGADTLSVSRFASRRGGELQTLYVEELCWPCSEKPFWAEAGAILLDSAWIVLSGADKKTTKSVAANPGTRAIQLPNTSCRAVSVVGADGKTYFVLANFGDKPYSLDCAVFGENYESLHEPATSQNHSKLTCAPGTAKLLIEQPARCAR